MERSLSQPLPHADWPDRLLAFYQAGNRDLPWRKSRDPYAIYVSEIMLQQTQVQTVIPYFERFMVRFPDLASLAAAEPDELHRYWAGLGYYSRVRQMQKAAVQMMDTHSGCLPADPDLLQTLPGIGAYTAGAICSIAFGQPIPAVDGNVVRVIARLYGLPLTQGSVTDRQTVATLIEPLIPRAAPGDFNQALMEHGALICTPAIPQCENCPLQTDCQAFSQGRVTELPLKPLKKTVSEENWTVVILKYWPFFRVSRRKQALLSGLYQFDMLSGHLDEPSVRLWAVDTLNEMAEYGPDFKIITKEDIMMTALPDRVHRFTHRLWRLSGFLVDCSGCINEPYPDANSMPDPSSPFFWVTADSLQELPFPTALSAYRKDALFDGCGSDS